MIQALFHPIANPTAEQVARGLNTRIFEVAEDTKYLEVPGLKSIESISLGSQPFPLEITEKYPDNADATSHSLETIPMVLLDNLNGTPVLLRSIKSNDGIWQKGTKVHIAGQWEDQAEAKTKG